MRIFLVGCFLCRVLLIKKSMRRRDLLERLSFSLSSWRGQKTKYHDMRIFLVGCFLCRVVLIKRLCEDAISLNDSLSSPLSTVKLPHLWLTIRHVRVWIHSNTYILKRKSYQRAIQQTHYFIQLHCNVRKVWVSSKIFLWKLFLCYIIGQMCQLDGLRWLKHQSINYLFEQCTELGSDIVELPHLILLTLRCEISLICETVYNYKFVYVREFATAEFVFMSVESDLHYSELTLYHGF